MIKKLNLGKIIGARASQNEWQVCRIKRFGPDTVIAQILESDREVRFNQSTGQGLDEFAEYKIVFTGPVPASAMLDPIAFMNSQLVFAKS